MPLETAPLFDDLSRPLAPDDGANAPKIIAAQYRHLVEHRTDLNFLPTWIAEHLAGRADGERPRLEHAHRGCAIAPYHTI